MGDRNASGAVEVVTTPDYDAMVIGAHPDDDDLERLLHAHYGLNKDVRLYGSL